METRYCWSQIEQVHVHCNTHTGNAASQSECQIWDGTIIYFGTCAKFLTVPEQLTQLNCSFKDILSRYVLLAALFYMCLTSSHVWISPEEKLKDSFSYISYDRDRVHSFVEASGRGSTFKELRVSIVDACTLSPTLGLWMAPGFQTKTWCHDGGRGLYWACAVRREARLDLRSRATTDR